MNAGDNLGTYRVLGKIGEGGMGEVYRAIDTRLRRSVAIKVLPTALTADHDRLIRFEREAQLLASLNHPNIAHVYGFESATLPDGSSGYFIAMELVEGEDLGERLKRGPIALDEAMAIARQIAEAFEEAHERGIVHRDLKPANVKITPDGKVKVLDFGLAKAIDRRGRPPCLQSTSRSHRHSPTSATQLGMILGTAAYMAPEQARGTPVDRRADIWAFGVVLYEIHSRGAVGLAAPVARRNARGHAESRAGGRAARHLGARFRARGIHPAVVSPRTVSAVVADGARIAWLTRNDEDVVGIYEKRANGVGDQSQLLKLGAEVGGTPFPTDWSADGRFLLYYGRSERTRIDIWACRSSATASRIPSSTRSSTSTRDSSRPTGTGSRIDQTSMVVMKSTSSRSPLRARWERSDAASRPEAAARHGSAVTARSSSTWPTMAG